MKIVVGYVRVSTLDQSIDGVSRERQKQQIQHYCRTNEIPDLEIIIDDGHSGYKENRPGFQRLISLCKSKKVKAVVVYDLSRLSRSVRTTLMMVEDVFTPLGIDFISLKDDIDTSTPMGKAFLTFVALFNQLYRDEISYKTLQALAHKRFKAEKLGGIVPYGFTADKALKLHTDDHETATIRLIIELRRSGATLRGIADHLQANAIPTKTGLMAWSAKVVRDLICRHQKQNKEVGTKITDCPNGNSYGL